MHAFDTRQLAAIAQQYGAPLWIYHADTIRRRIAELSHFDTIRYAQKANSNTHILRLMREQGVKVDAVSLGEIERALAAGYQGGAQADIVFTADVLDRATLARVAELGIPVNAGSIDMLSQLGAASPGHPVWLRINPGFGHGHSQKTNTGGENSKHGIWHADLELALAEIRRHRLQLVGIHMHIGSGVDYGHLQRVCGAMVELVQRLDCDIEAISAGGGLSIPYRDGDARIDADHYFELWDEARRQIADRLGHPLRLEIEPGRFLVAESGVLLSEVRAVKNMGSRRFVLVDAGFNDLMRPSLYGSYHHITVLDAQGAAKSGSVDTVVAGPLCESGDVFTQREGGTVEARPLPPAAVGDLLLFHDAGAYGATMSSNYNSRPLLAEVLVDGGAVRQIRRRQTMAELLALEA
ncbi:diaminopimelate decarboxylase [Chromobacterium subtsugae]|uniref:Diaminopimelate decarboxylase n=1 Tax=Chromobacterium subtsugae TaxID=251747 RepID=A0ABS7FD85_9NEIS|nr:MULTISPECIES: diaminopimelate decarboxylase [Chromobacterium]KUM04899.1 diaminopimelate decarboxylase [Chromobacterium subtsugae]KZE86985.1 diaminopimelate decarboxylase [Chromobacterium sp. F49]MBW7566748.1 diaminopimelate decarboxylase [Chromobacterium subtsugae]MBW8288053.1 diaminopimelate decarboxylase [Chromobacterium subtsugae]WSE92735.1 diaminopimelate decarboxylase [Chromobacterium subtsugae]